MLLQLQTFCCGETRRKHLHISLLFFCCFTGFFFLGELSSHLRPRFCCWSVLSFLDLALYHQRCKHRCPWRLNWIILCFYWILYLFFLNCKSFHYLFLGFFFFERPPAPPKKKKQKKGMWLYSLFLFSLFSPNLVMFNLLHGQTLKINISLPSFKCATFFFIFFYLGGGG